MQFMTIREFRSSTGDVRRRLSKDKELVLTANGRPFALVTAIAATSFEEELMAVRRARARAALDRLHADAVANGTDRLSQETIEAIIRKARKERNPA